MLILIKSNGNEVDRIRTHCSPGKARRMARRTVDKLARASVVPVSLYAYVLNNGPRHVSPWRQDAFATNKDKS